MTVQQVRVLLVDDSAVVRGAVGRMLDSTPDIRVVTTATNGKQALEALKHTEVDVVLLDVEMPEMDGLTALPLILERYPRVKVIMQSSLTQRGAEITMQALSLGAVDFIPKPTAKGTVGLAALEREVIAKIRALGRATGAATRPAPRPASPRPAAATPRAAAPANSNAILASGDATPRVLAIASSTGGPNALAEVLAGLPRDFHLPTVITQHMPPVFTGLLAQRLSRDCHRECVEATNGMPIKPGITYVAPGDFHMIVATHEGQPFLRLTQTEPENHCRPAADVMMRSVASVYGPSAIAVVLTGMGEDGKRGCEAIKARGGRVLAQDEATSIVWGMPGAVAQAGLAEWVLPLPDIAGKVTSLCGAAV